MLSVKYGRAQIEHKSETISVCSSTCFSSRSVVVGCRRRFRGGADHFISCCADFFSLRATTMCHFDSERTSNDPNVELFKAYRGIELRMTTQWDIRHTSFHRLIYTNKIQTIMAN